MEKFQISNALISYVLRTLLFVESVRCHGRLWEPPSRSTMWRLGYNTSVNINDNELNCGGFKNQWITYGGLCGVCGDPYQQHPRENEAGGKYASGSITRLYRTGDNIDATVDLTANHGGYFEFRLCPINGRKAHATQECFDKNPLLIKDVTGEDFKYHIRDRSKQGHMNMTIRLPPTLSCRHCVMQWRYWTASRWGCEDDVCAIGRGPQEEFYGCSDFAIAPPYAYESYRSLVTLPSASIVSYHMMDDLGNKDKHSALNDRKVDIILSEFAETNGEQKQSRFPNPILPSQTKKPKPKVLFKFPETVHKNVHVDSKKTVASELQQILVETILNYYKRNGKIVSNKKRGCVSNGKFSRNPIIQEWCSRSCPGLSRGCPPKMCSCQRKKVSKETLPFVDLSKYRSELIDKVPFELSNMLTATKLYDKTMNDKKANSEFKRDDVLWSDNAVEKRQTAFKRSRPRMRGPNFPFRFKPPLINFWKDAPFTAEVGQYTRFPIITRSKPRIYVIKRGPSKRTRLQKPDFRRRTPPSAFVPRVKTDFPLVRSNRFITRPPMVDGLTFFSALSPPKVADSGKHSILSQDKTHSKQEIQPSLTQKSKQRNIAPFKLQATRDLSTNPLKVTPRNIVCSGSALFRHMSSMIEWCQKNCSFGFCPSSVCKCL